MNMNRIFILLLSLLSLTHCTQLKRVVPFLADGQFANAGNIIFRRNITYGTFQTETLSMRMYGNYLLAGGKPFGFMVMDVTNPLNPVKVFASKEFISNFTQNFKFGAWIPDHYASGAMEVFNLNNNLMILSSGSHGASLLGGSLGALVEKFRFPYRNTLGNLPQDPRFIYKALVVNPSNQGLMYGITQQEGIYYLNTSNASAAASLYPQAPNVPDSTTASIYSSAISAFQPFSANGPVCCTTSASNFGGRIFIARTHDLVFYDIQSNGQLTLAGSDSTMSANYIAQTSSRLYVQSVGSQVKADGIYVYDASGNLVNFLPLVTRQFVVTSDNKYLLANIDNQSIEVYEIF